MPCLNQSTVDNPFSWQMGLYVLRAHVLQFPDIAARFDFHVYTWSEKDFRGGVPNPELEISGLIGRIIELQPRVVAFSLYVHTILSARWMTDLIKQLIPNVLVVVGGPEVVGRERFTSEHPMFDVAVEGAGEVPFELILQKMAAGDDDLSDIPNLSFRGPNGEFIHNTSADVDVPPGALADSFRQDVDKLYGKIVYVKSRGCRRNCSYCGWAKQPIRNKPTSLMLDEFKSVLATGRVDTLVFMDSDFLKIEREEPGTFAALADLLAQYGNPQLNFCSDLHGLLDPMMLEVVEKFKVKEIMLGIQSLNPAALKAVNRSWQVSELPKLEKVDPKVRRLVTPQLMVPLPGETVTSFYEGIQRLWTLGFLQLQVFPTMVLHGTQLRTDAARLGVRYLTMPPYLAFETQTMSALETTKATQLGIVLSKLLWKTGSLVDGRDRLLQLWERHPNLVTDVREVLDAGNNFERTLAHFLPEKDRGTVSAASVERPSLTRTLFPPMKQIRRVLLHHGMMWLGEDIGSTRLAVAITGDAGHCILCLFPATVPEPYYREANGFRIAYHGELADLSVLDDLLELCKGSDSTKDQKMGFSISDRD
jgi:hypothetical protein